MRNYSRLLSGGKLRGQLKAANEALGREIAAREGLERKLAKTVAAEQRNTQLRQELELEIRQAFDAACVGTWKWDVASGALACDPLIKKLYGLAPDASMTRIEQLLGAIHPADREAVRLAMDEAIAGGTDYNTEFRVLHPDGSTHWVGARGAVLRGPDNKAVGMAGINIDIATRKRAETAFQDSLQQLRQLADAMPQLVWISAADGKVLWFNERWHDYTGTPSEQLLESWLDLFHPEDQDRLVQTWANSLATEELYEIEYRCRRHDGIFRWFLGRAIPVRDSSGAVVRWFGTCTDIEGYKEAEAEIKDLNESLEDRVRQRTAALATANEELARTQARLQGVLNAATQLSIIVTDTDGLIRVFNSGAEKMLQYQACEMEGLQTPALIHVESEVMERSRVLSQEFGRPIEGFDVFTEHARNGRPEEREWTYLRKGGSTLEVSLAVTAVHGPSGKLDGFLGMATDITARKSMEREIRLKNEKLVEQTRRAEYASRAKSEFLATMSHEIRTPMNGVLGMTSLLAETPLSAEQRDFVETIRRSGDALLTIINDVLDFSRIEAGRLYLECFPFDLRSLLEEAVDLVSTMARGKSLELCTALGSDVPAGLIGDAGRLRQILLNLLTNALKFTESGEVIVSVELEERTAAGARIRIAVTDTGIGINEEAKSRLFRSFSQADSSTTRKYGGTGLGLAISKQLLDLMGGAIGVCSEAGKGSTFWFTVTLPETDQAKRPAAVLSNLRGKKVVVVDDNPTNLKILEQQLGRAGMIVTIASSGDEGLRQLAEMTAAGGTFDLGVLDLHMPGMDGLTLAKRIRSVAANGSFPLIMLTSFRDREEVDEAKAIGITAYLTKPVREAHLLRAISEALGGNLTQAPVYALPDLSPIRGRILVAEDNPTNQKVAALRLQRLGCQVDVVANGLEAVEAWAKVYYSLILMDCEMPEMDGFEATQRIRQRERSGRRTPIIALTANALPGERERCLAAGMDDYLAKPLDAHELTVKLRHWIAGDPNGERKALKAAEPEAGLTNNSAEEVAAFGVAMREEGYASVDIEGLLRIFLDTTPPRFENLIAAVESRNGDAAARTAHAIRGAFSSVGLHRLAAAVREVEQGCRTPEAWEIVQRLMPNLARDFQQAQVQIAEIVAATAS